MTRLHFGVELVDVFTRQRANIECGLRFGGNYVGADAGLQHRGHDRRTQHRIEHRARFRRDNAGPALRAADQAAPDNEPLYPEG